MRRRRRDVGPCIVSESGKVVSGNFGSALTSWQNNAGSTTLTSSIPNGFYANQNVNFTDADLLSANIATGVEIFGVTGSLIEAYAACSDNMVNATQCSTTANRYVTSTNGSNVTGANGSLSALIPQGFYDGTKTCTMSHTNLTAANIKKGVSVFGVMGNFIGSFNSNMASTMFRSKSATQISMENEAVSDAPNYPINPAGYRAVPNIEKDDDGRVLSVDAVNRSASSVTGAWLARTCGLAGSIEDRIIGCADEFEDDATWDGSVKGNSGQGAWKLVTRTGAMDSNKGREVWQDQRTGLLWSSRVSNGINWCKASGVNNITGNPAAQDDPNDFCDDPDFQTTGTVVNGDKAVSACFEDSSFFTTTDGNNKIDSGGKSGLGQMSVPAVAWRLPTRDDYFVADVNGLRHVLPDAGDAFGYWEWTSTIHTNNRARAYMFSTWDGSSAPHFDRGEDGFNDNISARCIGR